MSSQLVTEFIAEKPLVLVVGEGSKLTKTVVSLLEEQDLRTTRLSYQEIDRDENRRLLQSAYKVIWVNENESSQAELFKATLAAIKKTGVAATIVFPVLTGVKSPQKQADFGFDWAVDADLRKEMILNINEKLPTAQFIFIRDLTDQSDLKHSPLKFLLEKAAEAEIFDPEIDLNPLGYEEMSDELRGVLIRPHAAGSYLIEAPGQSSTSLIRQLAAKIEQYHDVDIAISSFPQVVDHLLPFSAAQRLISEFSTNLLQEVARAIPKPRQTKKPLITQFSDKGSSDIVPPPQSTSSKLLEKQAKNQPPSVQEGVRAASAMTSSSPPPPKEKPRPAAIIPDDPLDINEELQKIFATARSGQRVTRVKSKAKTQKKQKRKRKSRTALFWGGMVSIAAACLILLLSGVFLTTQYLMKRSLMSVVAQAAADQNLRIVDQDSWGNTNRVASALSFQTELYAGIFNTSALSQASLMTELVEQMKTMSQSIGSTQEAASELVLQVLTGRGGDTQVTAQKLLSEADKSYNSLSLFQAGLDQLDLSGNDRIALEMVEQYETRIRDLRQGLAVVQQLDPHLPSLTGAEGKKTYALLLQNNHELRPTGGFISAVALLNFERGTLVSYQVYSSYDLDKRLAGTVTPPGDIVNYLGEQNWYLRDSNWDPHFPASAEQISWFIENAAGVKVDGVFGINLLVVEDLISALGPIDLPEYNETLTDRNLQERMEFHSEVVLVPQDGSRDYSALVLEKLVEKLRSVQADKTGALLSALAENLSTQQMTVAVFEDEVANTLSSLGWTGALVSPDCPSQLGTDDCRVDSIAQVEANVGVNKANYYLKRSINHNITLNTGVAEHQRIITLENTAQSNAWPKGSYRSFIRFYLPPSSHFSTLSINGSTLPADQVVEREENGKKVIGALIEVPVKTISQLTLEYQVPLQMEAPFSYAFFNQNQSGTTQTPVTVKITSPSSLQPALIAPQAEVLDNTIIFDNINEKHSFVGVNFQ